MNLVNMEIYCQSFTCETPKRSHIVSQITLESTDSKEGVVILLVGGEERGIEHSIVGGGVGGGFCTKILVIWTVLDLVRVGVLYCSDLHVCMYLGYLCSIRYSTTTVFGGVEMLCERMFLLGEG